MIGLLQKSSHSDWLFDSLLKQRQKYSIACVSFTGKLQRGNYKSKCPYIGPSVRTLVRPSAVRLSVRPSVHWSVHPSVRPSIDPSGGPYVMLLLFCLLGATCF